MALPVDNAGGVPALADDALESIELDLLLRAIERRWGYDFRDYATSSIRRRVREAMEKEGAPTLSALQERILRDGRCMERFVSVVSVHVTSMFRDPGFYAAFRLHVVPRLRTYPFVRIWHAGCASGEEVYSMAILLTEEGLYDRCRLYATDISNELLEQGRRGIYPAAGMREYTANYHRAGGKRDFSDYYTADQGHAIMRESLRKNVIFAQHNLVSDRSFNEFNVILCRNVIIYFNEALRERVHQLFYGSLGTFGFLGLGARENLLGTPQQKLYEELPGNVGLYRRIR